MEKRISLTEVLDFFLPRICPHCGAKLKKYENIVCRNCFHLMKEVGQEILDLEFRRKFLKEGVISGLYSLYLFENTSPVRDVIHSLKYGMGYKNGVFLGKLLGNAFKEKLHELNIDLVIPIPLHKLKQAERGYNQSYYIASGLTSVTGLCLKDNIISRKRFTESQTTMSLEERQQNIVGAFEVKKPRRIAGKKILLIDDVITTGSTVTECGRELLNNGAHKVYAASAAFAE